MDPVSFFCMWWLYLAVPLKPHVVIDWDFGSGWITGVWSWISPPIGLAQFWMWEMDSLTEGLPGCGCQVFCSSSKESNKKLCEGPVTLAPAVGKLVLFSPAELPWWCSCEKSVHPKRKGSFLDPCFYSIGLHVRRYSLSFRDLWSFSRLVWLFAVPAFPYKFWGKSSQSLGLVESSCDFWWYFVLNL